MCHQYIEEDKTLFCKIGVARNCPSSTFRILVSWGGGLIGFGATQWVKCNVDAEMAACRLGGLSVMLMRCCFKVSVQRSGGGVAGRHWGVPTSLYWFCLSGVCSSYCRSGVDQRDSILG
ncbi:hypothetical protein V6Z11_D11G207100 [Gossypium hirsutum]|uniref:Uncharacterized protein n=1 Tax=Gossypium hirsutum TaxID=3635 RepID=A0ABM3B5Z2_GOSHI|nr:uncharacterized protein LOC121223826 [Gossypium hirsutum]